MDSEREGFLRAIAANPDDHLKREIYADYLDDRGEVEEADRMRKWKHSRDWVQNLIAGSGWTYAQFMEAADEAYREWKEEYEGRLLVDRTEGIAPYMSVGDDTNFSRRLNDHSEEFWADHYYVLTGNRVPREVARESYFSCAC